LWELLDVSGRHRNELSVCSVAVFPNQSIVSAEIVIPVEAVFAVSAGYSLCDHNAISSCHMVDTFAHVSDDSCCIHTRYERQWELDTGQSLANPEVQVIDGSRFHVDQNIAWTDCRCGNVLLHQSIDAAMLVNPHTFHSKFPKIPIPEMEKYPKIGLNTRRL
jgi:hypothetical protein